MEPLADAGGFLLLRANLARGGKEALLFFHSGRDRRTLLPVHPLPYREQPCSVPDDKAHAPVLSVRHVREGRPSL